MALHSALGGNQELMKPWSCPVAVVVAVVAVPTGMLGGTCPAQLLSVVGVSEVGRFG